MRKVFNMVSRFISKEVNSGFNSRIHTRLTKGQAMVRGRDAALKEMKILRKMREARKKESI